MDQFNTDEMIGEETVGEQDSDETQETQPEVQIDSDKLEQLIDYHRSQQNLALGAVGGVGAALIGAGLWAWITVLTGYQIGWMAVGVGFLVGYSIRLLGKGVDTVFGIIGAVLALLGCVLGNLLGVFGFIAADVGIPYFELLFQIKPSAIPQLVVDTFHPMDLLFYGIAVYEGYRLSFRQLSEEDLSQVISEE